jgi:hypothetical protein
MAEQERPQKRGSGFFRLFERGEYLWTWYSDLCAELGGGLPLFTRLPTRRLFGNHRREEAQGPFLEG